jgi:hypothetical protein
MVGRDIFLIVSLLYARYRFAYLIAGYASREIKV